MFKQTSKSVSSSTSSYSKHKNSSSSSSLLSFGHSHASTEHLFSLCILKERAFYSWLCWYLRADFMAPLTLHLRSPTSPGVSPTFEPGLMLDPPASSQGSPQEAATERARLREEQEAEYEESLRIDRERAEKEAMRPAASVDTSSSSSSSISSMSIYVYMVYTPISHILNKYIIYQWSMSIQIYIYVYLSSN